MKPKSRPIRSTSSSAALLLSSSSSSPTQDIRIVLCPSLNQSMESLSLSAFLSTPSPPQNHRKPLKLINLQRPISSISKKFPSLSHSHPGKLLPLLPLSLADIFTGPLPSFAADTSLEEPTSRINVEAILVSIDDFFNRNPFFVAGCTFIWLVVIPVAEYYLMKYKFISAIDAFRRLRDDPQAQLLDIRGRKSAAAMAAPSLSYMKKRAVHVPFNEGEDELFVEKVKERFGNPSDTVLCILDDFDGDSFKVAEFLFKNGGFKEAYAIKDGVRGKKGWLAIQETLLPPAVHMLPKKKDKASGDLGTNGAVSKQGGQNDSIFSSLNHLKETERQQSDTEGLNKSDVSPEPKNFVRGSSSSPYPNYPDLKPPSSPTPAKPKH